VVGGGVLDQMKIRLTQPQVELELGNIFVNWMLSSVGGHLHLNNCLQYIWSSKLKFNV
jgi:hypothetical protein